MASYPIGCGGGGGGDSGVTPADGNVDTLTDGNVDTPKIIERTLFTNPTDSMLYSLNTDSDEELTYFGPRDESGKASAITMLNYVDADGFSYEIFFDDHGLPAKIIDEQGIMIEFEYDYTGSNIEGKSAGSSLQDGLSSIDTMAVYVSMIAGGVPVEMKSSITLDRSLVVEQNIPENRPHDPGNIIVNVSKCGEPFKPKGVVKVNFSRPWSDVRRYPAEPTSELGKYTAWIPQRPSATHLETPITAEQVEEMCMAVADKISDACQVFNPDFGVGYGGDMLANPAFQTRLCLQVSAMAAVTPAAPIAPEIMATCVTLFYAGTLTCKTLGFSTSTLPDAQNIMQVVCGEVEEMITDAAYPELADKVTIEAWADFRGDTGIVGSGEKEVLSIGPFPPLSVEGLEFEIDEITTSPNPPVAGKKYTATARLSCALGKELWMGASRSGLVIAEKGPEFTNEYSPTISVDVPSASAGTVDDLRVLAIDMFDPTQIDKKDIQVTFASDDDGQPEDDTFTPVYGRNFDGTYINTDDPADYDIQVSGDAKYPTFDWKNAGATGNGAIEVILSTRNGEARWCIESEWDPVKKELIPFNPPVDFGDYGIANTRPCDGYSNLPDPVDYLIRGAKYSVRVYVDGGKLAYMQFIPSASSD